MSMKCDERWEMLASAAQTSVGAQQQSHFIVVTSTLNEGTSYLSMENKKIPIRI